MEGQEVGQGQMSHSVIKRIGDESVAPLGGQVMH